MKSKTMEEAKNYYEENNEMLIKIMFEKFHGRIDNQSEFDQVAVWFDEFSLCYQNSDMNGKNKGEPHWNNDGANDGVDLLKNILSEDERFQRLIAEDEYWKNEYLNILINDFCEDFAEKNKIADYFQYNQIEI